MFLRSSRSLFCSGYNKIYFIRWQDLCRWSFRQQEMQHSACVILLFLSIYALCWPYDESLVDYNLNDNKSAESPLDYWGVWPDHEYHPSPDNWRFPVYTIFLDRVSNGDPTNDDINGTAFEHVVNSNQMRHGGDLDGLIDTLDYIQGMGFKVG